MLSKIHKENETFKQSPDNQNDEVTAFLVTSLYQKLYDEIKSFVDKNTDKNLKMGSIYTYLYSEADTDELCKRLILDQSFFEVTKTRV